MNRQITRDGTFFSHVNLINDKGIERSIIKRRIYNLNNFSYCFEQRKTKKEKEMYSLF